MPSIINKVDAATARLKLAEKRYKCQNCGRIITEIEILEDIEAGSTGHCLCEYDSSERILNEFVPIEDDIYNKKLNKVIDLLFDFRQESYDEESEVTLGEAADRILRAIDAIERGD